MGSVAEAFVKGGEFRITGAGGDGGAGNFVAVEVQDGENRAVARGIQKFDALPTAFERAGFGFTIADDAGDDEFGIVEGGSEGVDERVAEFAAFVHRVGRVRAAVAGYSAWGGKRAEEEAHAVEILGDFGMHFGVGAFQVGAGVHGGAAVARAGDENNVGIALAEQAIEMRVDEILSRGGTPVAEEARFDVLFF